MSRFKHASAHITPNRTPTRPDVYTAVYQRETLREHPDSRPPIVVSKECVTISKSNLMASSILPVPDVESFVWHPSTAPNNQSLESTNLPCLFTFSVQDSPAKSLDFACLHSAPKLQPRQDSQPPSGVQYIRLEGHVQTIKASLQRTTPARSIH